MVLLYFNLLPASCIIRTDSGRCAFTLRYVSIYSSANDASLVMLLINVRTIFIQGQVIDAVMTPIFGFLIDRYCKKKIWHVVGSIMVTVSFPVIFGGFVNSSTTIAMLLYVTSITIFQTGWAAVQISHLSMIPSLTNSVLARADLTAIRYVNCIISLENVGL